MILEKVTQTVLLNGTQILVSNCQVSRSVAERVGSIDFVVERDVIGDALYAATITGATITHTHAVVDGASITETAEVIEVTETYLAGAGIKRVRCRTQEAEMRDIRVVAQWTDELASTVVAQIAALHPSISAGSIAVTGRRVSRVSSRFDSLYDCLEQVRLQTGLAWRVSNNQLHLINPDSNIGPEITQLETTRGTLNVKTNSEMLYNVARMQAYEYRDIYICAPACSTFQEINLEGVGWELSGEIEKSPLFFPGRFNVNFESKEANWDQSPYPFYARFRARRLAWVQAIQTASLVIYGRKEGAPLPTDGGTGIDEAYSILTNNLETAAWPTIEINGVQPTIFGHDTDSRVFVSYPSRGIERYFYIDRVTRTMSKTELTVTIDLKESDD